jgi:transposase
MDMDKDSGFVGPLAVVDTGRRRRFSAAEKLRIVEESLAGERQASATARRHDISPSLLYRWRQLYRDGLLGGSATPAFIPAHIIAAEIGAAGSPPTSLPTGGRMEIVLAATRRIIVGADVDAAALGRVLDVLERR